MSAAAQPLLGALREVPLAAGTRVVVAYSGGLDSSVLLHLLRFSAAIELEVRAAHFDHRMRPGSDGDAEWVRGVCRAWGVPLLIAAAPRVPGDEAEARDLRYEFLESARGEVEARWILTAHHADDQAETVLFRVLRGTGIRGLGGMPRIRGHVMRPLLPLWQDQLRAYAASVGIGALEDPTNRVGTGARTVLRRDVLPAVERDVSVGARKALVRLARVARADEEAWEARIDEVWDAVVEVGEKGRIVIARSDLQVYHPGVRARLLRRAARRLGTELNEAGTRLAVEFSSTGSSGRGVRLSGTLVLAREFERLVLHRERPAGSSRPVQLDRQAQGVRSLLVQGCEYRVRVSRESPPDGTWVEGFVLSGLSFPLVLRGWSPGDRIRRPYGSKAVSKLMAEARVGSGLRARTPVLVDAQGEVLWVPGLARAGRSPGVGDGPLLFIGIDHDD